MIDPTPEELTFTVEDEIKDVKFGRPHVVVIGAGASLAAFPSGDANGFRLPLMIDFVEVLNLGPFLQKNNIDYKGRNFEEIYSGLYEQKREFIKKTIEEKTYSYFSKMRLPDNFPLDSIYNRYKNAKESKKSERAYARLNRKSRCLYVGSSKGLIPRIKQHLGFGPKGTFAMQLCYWCENLDLDITLNIYAFGNGISIKAFQAFDDGAWNSLKPMLGRQGKK